MQKLLGKRGVDWMNAGILRFLEQFSKEELILMVVKMHNANLAVRAMLSDMTWIETKVDE
jgi:predicted ribosome-associated RNA-binding protein Tma20